MLEQNVDTYVRSAPTRVCVEEMPCCRFQRQLYINTSP